MKTSQLAAQLYSVRDHLKTPADIATSLKKIRAIGYPAVQVSGMGPIAEADLVQLCQDNGLTLCATHESGDLILNEPQTVVARLKKLGCRITAYPYPGGINFSTLESVKEFCRRLNAAGKVLHEAGPDVLGLVQDVEELDDEAISDIRLALSQSQPLGDDRFAERLCAKVGVRRAQAKRGRPAGKVVAGIENQAGFGF